MKTKLVPFSSKGQGKKQYMAKKGKFMIVIQENIDDRENHSSRIYTLGNGRNHSGVDLRRLIKNFKRTRVAQKLDYTILIYNDKGEGVVVTS